MSATATCPSCGKVLRIDHRPGEKRAPDLSPRTDCPQCEPQRRKLDVAQVVAARVPHLRLWEQNEEWEP